MSPSSSAQPLSSPPGPPGVGLLLQGQHRRRRRASAAAREQARANHAGGQHGGALERPLRRENLGAFPRPAAPASAALPASLKKLRLCFDWSQATRALRSRLDGGYMWESYVVTSFSKVTESASSQTLPHLFYSSLSFPR